MRDEYLDDDNGDLIDLRKPHFWRRQAPFILLLVLTLIGVAYWSFARTPIVGYWMFLAVAYAAVCVATGWRDAEEKDERFRLIWTQTAHWLAILVAMNILLLPNVAEMANADAIGQAILLVLAIGAVLAAIHIPSWQLGFLGVLMAIGVPALAWLEESALILVLGVVIIGGLAGFAWWRLHEMRASRSAGSGF